MMIMHRPGIARESADSAGAGMQPKINVDFEFKYSSPFELKCLARPRLDQKVNLDEWAAIQRSGIALLDARCMGLKQNFPGSIFRCRPRDLRVSRSDCLGLSKPGIER